jgi:hypothetical protein
VRHITPKTTKGARRPSMTKDTAKTSPKPEAKKFQNVEREDNTSHKDELTNDQLVNVTGGGGDPTIVRD